MDAVASTRGIEEPNKDVGACLGRMKEPNVDANTSIYGVEKPHMDTYDATYGSKEPNVNAGNSTNSVKESTMDVGAFTSVQDPNMDVGAPIKSRNDPNVDMGVPPNNIKEPNMNAGASTSTNEPNMAMGPPTNSRKEPNIDVGVPTNSLQEPNMDAGPSSSMKEPNYGVEKPNKNTHDSAYRNTNKYGGNYSYDNPYTDDYGSNYSYDNPRADDYDGNYGYEDPYTDQYDSNYSYENPYTDDYDSAYGNEDPYADAYDSNYGNQGPYTGARDSAYANDDPTMDSYDSSYGNEHPTMKMNSDTSGTGGSTTSRALQCSTCYYFAPSNPDLDQHFKSALHKYIIGLDRKRRNLIKNVQSLDDAIVACGESDPLIGLEYIYQYAPNKKGVVLYGCKLCQSVYRLDCMYLHIASPKHRITYLSKHHPKMGIDIDFILNDPTDYDRLHDIVQSVERNFGRKRIHYLDTCHSQKQPVGEMDGPPVTKRKTSRWTSIQNCPQSTDKWHAGDNYNNESMDHGGKASSQSYDEGGPASSGGHASLQYGNGEGRGGPGNVNRFSRQNRFSEPVPQDYNSSDFPGNRNAQSATQKGGINSNYQNRQGVQNRQDLESGHGNADNRPRRPNQDNQNVPNRMRNPANDFPDDRRADSRFDNRQGSGKQDRFSNTNDQQRNRDQFSRNERRDQNDAPRGGRFGPGDRDNSRFDRRARSPDNFRRGSEKQGGFGNADDRRRNDDRFSHNDRRDQNVLSRGRQNRQGGNNKRNYNAESHNYEDDYYGKADDRRQNNNRRSRERQDDRNERQNRDRDLPGNQSSGEEGCQHDDQKDSPPESEPKEVDPDRIYVFSTFGKNATFLELKKAYEEGHIMKKSQEEQDKDQAMAEDSDMDAQSMDLSDDEEGGFLFNQELFEFLNSYNLKSETDEPFVAEARDLLCRGLKAFDMQEKQRLEEALAYEMPIEDSTSDAYDQCIRPIKDYFSYNDTDERDEMDYQDDDDDDDEDVEIDDDVDLNDVFAQLVASQNYISSRPRAEHLPQPARENRHRTRFSS